MWNIRNRPAIPMTRGGITLMVHAVKPDGTVWADCTCECGCGNMTNPNTPTGLVIVPPDGSRLVCEKCEAGKCAVALEPEPLSQTRADLKAQLDRIEQKVDQLLAGRKRLEYVNVARGTALPSN
jgi:hypothetical protein